MWIRKVKTLFVLPLKVKLLFIKTLMLFFVVEITLRFLPFKRVMNWLGSTVALKTSTVTTELPEEIQAVKSMIRSLSRYLPFVKCYNKALTARILLRNKGYASTLYIGFKKEKEQLKGHAWLVFQDQLITGGAVYQEYKVTAFFP